MKIVIGLCLLMMHWNQEDNNTKYSNVRKRLSIFLRRRYVMELLILSIFIIMAYTKNVKTERKRLVKLPVGRNTEGYFDDKAFTEINLTLKEGRNNG